MGDRRRSLTEVEKAEVRNQQRLADGSLLCFITGRVIGEGDDVEYDHIEPHSKDGDTSIHNMRAVLKQFNRRKGDQSLTEFRDNWRLAELFEQKKNDIRLQDIFTLKDIKPLSIHSTVDENTIRLTDGKIGQTFPLYADETLTVPYFYGQVPLAWLENDDQEGLQPRVIDYKRLLAIRDHLRSHPQLAPSIGRLVKGRIKLFDGQHKLAAQVLNDRKQIDIKIYVAPDDPVAAKKLFDSLMITNLDAHSKLKQVPFYTSTLLDRLSAVYKEMVEEFISGTPVERHSEINLLNFMVNQKSMSKTQAREMLRGAIQTAAMDGSAFVPYIAKASKDPNFPITVDLLTRTILSATLNLEPATARFMSDGDHRSRETENFAELSKIVVARTDPQGWVPKGSQLSSAQRKARRIWHRGSVLTWAPYLKSILIYAMHMMTSKEREQMLYRPALDTKQLEIIDVCVKRLFSHPFWDDPDPSIDSLLVSAKKQDDLFLQKGLTEKHVLYGTD